MSLLIKRSKEIEIMGDQELWNLLNGYGPNDRNRSDRHMPFEERGAYLLSKIKTVMNGTKDADIRLVLEIKEKS